MSNRSSMLASSVALIIGLAWLSRADLVIAQSSVLASGTWYKMAVEKNGVYRIDQGLFKKMGFNPTSTDPRKIKIYTQGGGMLPQPNSAPRAVDLVEVAIHIPGETDGVFNQQDVILFYAEGPDKVSFNEQDGIFHYKKNLYAKENYYYITVGGSPGKRIQTSENLGNNFPVVDQFENFIYHELDQYNHLKSGREWYGERFGTTTQLTLPFDLKNIVANSDVIIISDVVSINNGLSAISATSFSLSLNGYPVGPQNIPPIPYSEFGTKGLHALNTFRINASASSASQRNQQEIKYQYNKSTSGTSIGFLDYLLLQVTQNLALYGNQTIFTSLSSLEQPVSRFDIAGTNAQTLIWEITNPLEPALQAASFNSNVTSFATSTSTLKNFIAFLPGAPAPKLVGSVANQNLHVPSAPELIIVTHPNFKSEALRLKQHRENFNSINVVVVSTEEVYNEFSGGKQDVSAIRDLAKYFYDKAPGSLKALLLFGKCSYDYKDVLVDNKNFVPTYQSRNSLHPLQTYSSDDFFGFMENHEGEWSESPADNHTMDIAVGRLPVKSVAEAKNVVDKIIHYDTNRKLFNRWRKNMVFVADDGDPFFPNLHQRQADSMARNIDLNYAHFDTRKIYLDAFQQVSGAGGEVSPQTRGLVEKAFYDGALVLNYTGHGSERQWAQERILDEVLILNLKNERLPLLVTATCAFGRQDDPLFPSGGELCMLQPKGGAIGLVTTARPVFSSTNFELNQAFYNAFFQKENGKNLSLGEIFRRTKNTSISGVLNRNFSLIGDPSLYLAMPEYEVQVNSIVTSTESSLLKALSGVQVTGEIVDEQKNKVDDFNGIIEATLFDKATSFITLGNENPPFAYTQWFNALFRGKATVQNGDFEFQFIMPKNIAYAVDVGKLSLYAYQENDPEDASGYSQDFTIGSSESTTIVDTTPPTIRLYMDDVTFKNGGVTNPNTLLLAKLSDENGINISGYGIGNSIIAVLDDNTSYILNDYYEADTNDYKNGTITFQLNDLLPGKHTLTLRVWDTNNNPAQGRIDFVVSEGGNLVIEDFYNYPNPFNVSTELVFRHNQSGKDLEASLAIYDYSGKTITTYEFSIPESTYEVSLLELTRANDFVKNLKAGLYLARLMVRSLADGSKNERVTKLIITN